MPSGTTVKVFAARIHKSNAEVVLEEAKRIANFLTSRLIGMACATPSNAGVEVLDELIREVEEVVEELVEASFREICARNIVDFPEDCEDENECAECGQDGFHKMSCGSK